MNIVVLLGGISPERNISYLSGRAVVAALRENGHTVVALDPAHGANSLVSDSTLDAATNEEVSLDWLSSQDPKSYIDCIQSSHFDNVDCAFNALHGKWGEDGNLQALLAFRGVPVTGSPLSACAIAMDKALSKLLFVSAGIPTPRWHALHRSQFDDLSQYGEIIDELGTALVVKPNDAGSSVGMTLLETAQPETLHTAVLHAGTISDTVLIERLIKGRELTVGILGDQALPVVEIIPKEGFYDYTNKYNRGMTEYICPADLDEEVVEHVNNLALTAYGIIGCTGYARLDFLLSDENYPTLLEINTIPGFTELSLFPMAGKAVGLEFGAVCERIVQLATGTVPAGIDDDIDSDQFVEEED